MKSFVFTFYKRQFKQTLQAMPKTSKVSYP